MINKTIVNFATMTIIPFSVGMALSDYSLWIIVAFALPVSIIANICWEIIDKYFYEPK